MAKPPKPTTPKIDPAILQKPSIAEALRASVIADDDGFTAEEMQQAWGYGNICSAVRRIKTLVSQGIFKCTGSREQRDSLGRPYRVPTYISVGQKTEPKSKKK